jgi:hypothetical protein
MSVMTPPNQPSSMGCRRVFGSLALAWNEISDGVAAICNGESFARLDLAH